MAGQSGQTATPYYTPPQARPNPTGTMPPPRLASPLAPKTPSRGLQALTGKLWLQASKTLKGQFMVLASLILVLAIILGIYVSQSFSHASTDLETIASGSVPSVDSAQSAAQYIDDIDAKAADYLATAALSVQTSCSVIGAKDSVGLLTVHDCDLRNINAEIILTNQQLYLAAHNSTYTGERTAIERITVGFEEYIGHLTVMQLEYGLAVSKSDPNDPHLQNAYSAYRAASAVLHTRIEHPAILAEPLTTLPACKVGLDQHPAQPADWVNGSIAANIDCLNAINYTHLGQGYDDTASFLGQTLTVVALLSLLFCLLLLFTTGRMALITHRFINLGLTPALLIGVIFTAIVLSSLAGLAGQSGSTQAAQHGAYQQMVKDDYASVYAAARLKRYGTDANADESRWLIAKAFNNQPEIDKWQADWETNVQQIKQLMTAAGANQTWPEEVQPLSDMRHNWQDYYAIDDQIRTAANNGHIQEAETLSTGKSNLAFGGFSDAVDQLSQANYEHYNITLNATRAALSLSTLLSAILFPVLGLLALWGATQRLKDF